jgi:ABC-2 type transport system ATP-binding protein
MIRLDRLSKNFRHRCALSDLSMEVRAGEIFGLLGHNGAGKSTAFGMMLGQLHPTKGEAFIRGISVQRERSRALQKVGAIFETPAFYDYMSGWNNLRVFTGYTAKLPKDEIAEAVRFVGLESRIHDPVRVYSHGMRQRLALAQALLPQPDLLLLDEPAEGLDPQGLHEMRHLILRLNREHGMTVMLSSHLLSEVEQMCDRIAILNQGQLVFQGHWSELRSDGARYHFDVDDWPKAGPVIQLFGARLDEREKIVSLPAGRDIGDLVTALVREEIRVRRVEALRQSLEEIYLNAVSST